MYSDSKPRHGFIKFQSFENPFLFHKQCESFENRIGKRRLLIIYLIFQLMDTIYSDTSANKDNSFRNHIR
jgi:hypothetical protein